MSEKISLDSSVTDNIIYGNLYSKEVRTYVGSDLCVFGL